MSSEEITRISRRVPEEIATERNLDAIDELFAEDAVEHDRFGEEIRGRDAIREAFERLFTAFSDFEATVDESIAEGELSAMRVTLRGTHEGEFMGVDPTGEAFEVPNTVFTRVEDGKITERWLQPDMLGMLQHLGLVDPQFA